MAQDQPTEYPAMAPVLAVADAREALRCYSQALGVEVLYHLTDPTSGRWAHLEIRLPDGSLLMLEERARAGDPDDPRDPEPPRMRLCLFVADVDAVVSRCVEAGMRLLQPPKTHFHGHRCCLLEDPEGHQWMVSQVVEPLSPSEMQTRWDRLRARDPREWAPRDRARNGDTGISPSPI
ncbi:MAG: VOC family protein [Verrucomicrobiota bacterium]